MSQDIEGFYSHGQSELTEVIDTFVESFGYPSKFTDSAFFQYPSYGRGGSEHLGSVQLKNLEMFVEGKSRIVEVRQNYEAIFEKMAPIKTFLSYCSNFMQDIGWLNNDALNSFLDSVTNNIFSNHTGYKEPNGNDPSLAWTVDPDLRKKTPVKIAADSDTSFFKGDNDRSFFFRSEIAATNRLVFSDPCLALAVNCYQGLSSVYASMLKNMIDRAYPGFSQSHGHFDRFFDEWKSINFERFFIAPILIKAVRNKLDNGRDFDHSIIDTSAPFVPNVAYLNSLPIPNITDFVGEGVQFGYDMGIYKTHFVINEFSKPEAVTQLCPARHFILKTAPILIPTIYEQLKHTSKYNPRFIHYSEKVRNRLIESARKTPSIFVLDK